MYLKRLHLHNFRNLQEQAVSFSAGFNYVHGPNGAGKTALLEAIYLLARGRSFRTPKMGALIQYETPDLILRAEVVSESGQSHQLAMSKDRSGKTALNLDGQRQARASALAKHLPVQTLLPEASNLVLGSPGQRRAFLDWGLFHVEPLFVDLARNYRRVLMQRNAWLKSLNGNASRIEQDPWLDQFQMMAVQISEMRDAYIQQLTPYFNASMHRLAPELEVSVSYEWGGLNSAAEAEKKLGETWSRDVKFGATHRGPHRGDLVFLQAGRSAADAMSRGQAKLIASAAILAQAELLYALSRTKSLFLIDDFGAELDPTHWQNFLHTLLALECQVIATSTEPVHANQLMGEQITGLQMFHVEQGRFA